MSPITDAKWKFLQSLLPYFKEIKGDENQKQFRIEALILLLRTFYGLPMEKLAPDSPTLPTQPVVGDKIFIPKKETEHTNKTHGSIGTPPLPKSTKAGTSSSRHESTVTMKVEKAKEIENGSPLPINIGMQSSSSSRHNALSIGIKEDAKRSEKGFSLPKNIQAETSRINEEQAEKNEIRVFGFFFYLLE